MDKAERNTGRDPRTGAPVRIGDPLPRRQTARQAEAAAREADIREEIDGTAALENTGRDPVQGTPISPDEIPAALDKQERVMRKDIAAREKKE